MSIKAKIILSLIVLGVLHIIVLVFAVYIYAARITGQPLLNFREIAALFPGIAAVSILAPIVLGSYVIFVLLFLGIVQYLIFNPIKKYGIIASRAEAGESIEIAAISGDDELANIARNFTIAVGKLHGSYDALAGTLHSKYAVVGHDAEMLKLLVDHMPLGVFLIRLPDAEIIRINELAAQFIGRSVRNYKENTTFLRQNGEPYLSDELPYVIVEKTKIASTKSDLYFRYPDMRMAAFRMTSVPVFDSGGKLIYIISTLLDITDIKEVEREKSDFVSLASHQLRTPISIINWYIELLNAPPDIEKLTDDQKSFVAEIKESSQRMSRLIDTLLNASRVELGTFHGDGKIFDMVQVVDVAIRDTMALAQSKHQHIEKSYDLSAPLISGESKLGQVVAQNLLSNAVKYTGDGGLIKVSVVSQPDESAVHFIVEDNGIGIPEAETGRIFSRFYRASNARDVDSSGSGLGLSIVRSLLERAGGKISFNRIEGGGTRFEVIIPYTCKNI